MNDGSNLLTPAPDPLSGLSGYGGGPKLLRLPPSQDEKKRAAELAKPATVADREAVACLVSIAIDQQIERLQLLTDSALLAAEQVEDINSLVREIEAQKAGSMSAWDWIMLVVVLAVLFTPAGPVVAGAEGAATVGLDAVAKEILGDIMSTSKVFGALPKTQLGEDLWVLAVEEGSVDSFMKVVKDSLQHATTFSVRNESLYSGWVTNVVGLGTGWLFSQAESFLATAPSTVKSKATEGQRKPADSISPGDTPRVGLLAAAQSYVSDHRFALRYQGAAICAYVRSASFTRGDCLQISSLFNKKALGATVDDLRNGYKLYFEALLWATLYFSGSTLRAVESTKELDTISGVPSELKDYWHARFIAVPRVQQLIRQVGNAATSTVVSQALIHYFTELANALSRAARNTGVNLEQVLSVRPPS